VNAFFALLVGTLPVLLFLLALRVLDSYKLVHARQVALAIAGGAAAALLSWVPNAVAIDVLHLDPVLVRRYLAPVIEEILKASLLVYAIRSNRVGFLVDAGLYGFAVGAGFALVENLYYAWAAGTSSLPLWIARGFGTAMLHGTTTAVVGILSKHLVDRHHSSALHRFLPGLAIAIVTHSVYNHVLVNPLLATSLLLLVLPAMVFVVFEHSERSTRDWLGTGLDGDLERLEQILDGRIEGTPIGDYLESLRTRFEGPVLADMLCLLRIHLELSMRAKGQMIARAAGYDLPLGEDVRANFAELRYLEGAIGPTGRLALQPMLQTSRRDLWQRTVLGG
jgi:RsiW-degrading membrane proteinase PrsW (M82 family)